MENPKPMWIPSPEEVKATNLYRAFTGLGLSTYLEFHRWSVQNRELFWQHAVQTLSIPFKKPFQKVLDVSAGVHAPKWYVGAELNIVDACFQAPGDQTAVLWDDGSGELKRLTYEELRLESQRVARSLVESGFEKGDAIAIDMPMTMESVSIYLGIIMMGGVAISIADSFAPEEIRTRLKLARAKAIFTQDVMVRGGKILPLYEKVCDADAPLAIVLAHGQADTVLRPTDKWWKEFLVSDTLFTSVPAAPDSPVNILFSSGTTGEPKAIPWVQTTPIKCATDAYFHHDVQPGDVIAWPTNLGWMMGPWLIFAALINRGTIALYYDVPTDEAFGKFVEQAKVNILGLVPSLVKIWRQTGCMEKCDWSRIKAFSSTGECSNSDDYAYLMSLAGNRPVIEYCGGTEIGGGFITGTLVQSAAPGLFSTPALGIDFVILNERGEETPQGELFLIPPSVGLSSTLVNRDHYEVYYADTPKSPAGEVLRRHGDQFERVGEFFRGHGRVDDTMNLGGIKTSSAEIEHLLNQVPGVKETAAIAVNPPGGGPSLLVIYCVLSDAKRAGEMKSAFQTKIKSDLNPLFKVHDVRVVDKLPRTASNKVMRRVLRDEYEIKP